MTGNIASLKTISYAIMPMISSGGRTYVPVSPSEFGYSQFQYVAGYPAPKGQDGVSVDKVKILNTLIDQLVSMKQKNIHPKLTAHGDMDTGQIDALIKQYQEQIQTVTATAQNLLYKPLMPQTGAIVNLVA